MPKFSIFIMTILSLGIINMGLAIEEYEYIIKTPMPNITMYYVSPFPYFILFLALSVILISISIISLIAK
jgi:hypothetical protein